MIVSTYGVPGIGYWYVGVALRRVELEGLLVVSSVTDCALMVTVSNDV